MNTESRRSNSLTENTNTALFYAEKNVLQHDSEETADDRVTNRGVVICCTGTGVKRDVRK